MFVSIQSSSINVSANVVCVNWRSRYFPRKFTRRDTWCLRNDVVHGRGYLRGRPVDSHSGLQAVKPQCRITVLIETNEDMRREKKKDKKVAGIKTNALSFLQIFKLTFCIAFINQWIYIAWSAFFPIVDIPLWRWRC